MGARRVLARALIVPAALSGACATYGMHLTPNPLVPGEDELSLNADALLVDRGFGPQLLPNPEFGLRRGLSEALDIGARANVAGIETNLRWRFVQAGSFALALVPGAGFGFVPVTNDESGLFNAHALAALLAGVRLGGRAQTVFGLRGVATYAFPLTLFRGEASGAKTIYMPGAVLGVRFPVGRSSYLFPDVNVLVPYDSSRREWRFPIVQGGVAFVIE